MDKVENAGEVNVEGFTYKLRVLLAFIKYIFTIDLGVLEDEELIGWAAINPHLLAFNDFIGESYGVIYRDKIRS